MTRLAGRTRGRHVVPVALGTLLFAHVSALWGDGFQLFPSPLDAWHHVYHRLLSAWWSAALAPVFGAADADAVHRALEAYALGFAVPLLALVLAGRRPADAGLRRPARGSARLYLPWLMGAALLGLALAAATAEPWGSVLYEAMELAAMLPEHFLLFGVAMALVLPGGRLGPPELGPSPSTAPLHAHSTVATLRASPERRTAAVTFATALFAWVHVGMPMLELVVSIPMGLLFAELTLRTGSIWPALAIHWVLNLVPMALMP